MGALGGVWEEILEVASKVSVESLKLWRWTLDAMMPGAGWQNAVEWGRRCRGQDAIRTNPRLLCLRLPGPRDIINR